MVDCKKLDILIRLIEISIVQDLVYDEEVVEQLQSNEHERGIYEITQNSIL